MLNQKLLRYGLDTKWNKSYLDRAFIPSALYRGEVPVNGVAKTMPGAGYGSRSTILPTSHYQDSSHLARLLGATQRCVLTVRVMHDQPEQAMENL